MAHHEQGQPGGRLAQFKALVGNRSYVALWVGQTVSWVGNSFHRISLFFLLMEGVAEQNQHLPLLFLMLVHASAHLLVGPFAGVFVDRWSRKTVMIFSDLARAALVLMLPFVPGHAWLYALSFLVTVASLFFEPARHSSLPNVVSDKELFLANSFLATSESCAELVGLVAGGILVKTLGYRFAFFFDSFTFLVSAVAISLMTFHTVAVSERRPWQEEAARVVTDLRKGLLYAHGRVDIRALFGVYFFMAVALGSINYLLAAFAKSGLGMGPEAYAAMSGGIVAGYIVGSVVVAMSGSGQNRIAMIGLGLFGMGAGTVIMAGAHLLPVAVVGGFIGGLFNPVYYVASRTYLQESVPNEVLGRIFSLQFLVFQVGYLASVGLSALCLPWLGLRAWIVLSGVALALVGVLAPRAGVLGQLRRGELVIQA
ncbi:MAG: MFS transporter [Bacillota bacterium]|nr:MFS transporter [Bacillota bacterium]